MTGSTPYIAPENLLGKPYGKPADVFSFGILTWEILHCDFAVRSMMSV
jgi:serine/threonine protein kinase